MPKKTRIWAEFLPLLFLVWLMGCKQEEFRRIESIKQPANAAPARPSRTKADFKGESLGAFQARLGNRAALSPLYDEALREIIALAGSQHYLEAETRAAALFEMNPQDEGIQRVYRWIKMESAKRRSAELEKKSSGASSVESRFNPSLRSLLSNQKSTGLPMGGGLREEIERIKAEPIIPATYGHYGQTSGSLLDLERARSGKMAPLLSQMVDGQWDGATLGQILFQLSETNGINFIADPSLPAFQQRMSFKFKGATLLELFRYFERILGLQFQVGDDVIWILSGQNPQIVMPETRFYRLRHGFITPAAMAPTTGIQSAVQKTIKREPAKDSDTFVDDGTGPESALAMAMKRYFVGQYQIDTERNLVVARGAPQQLRIVDRLIEEYDQPLKQILIEVRFVLATEAAFNRLGVAWQSDSAASAGSITVDYTGLASMAAGMGIEHTWWGILGKTMLNAVLTAIDQKGEAITLSTCRLTVVNNLPGHLSDGKKQYYYESYNVVGAGTANRYSSILVPSGKPTSVIQGVTFDVMASVGQDSSILLALRPVVNLDVKLVPVATIEDRTTTGRVVNKRDIKLPEITQQSLATRITVKSGQTVLLGGAFQHQQRQFVEATPILANWPLIGAAFRRKTDQAKWSHLLAFVTATRLSEKGELMMSAEAQ